MHVSCRHAGKERERMAFLPHREHSSCWLLTTDECGMLGFEHFSVASSSSLICFVIIAIMWMMHLFFSGLSKNQCSAFNVKNKNKKLNTQSISIRNYQAYEWFKKRRQWMCHFVCIRHFNDVSNQKAHRCLVSITAHVEQMQQHHLRSVFHHSQFSLPLPPSFSVLSHSVKHL